MKITKTNDLKTLEMVEKGLRESNGYCPCKCEHTPENECMCLDFREMLDDPDYTGYCPCMYYYKSDED